MGIWLNKVEPKAAHETAMGYRAQELQRMVEVGAYQFPGLPAPESVEEGHALAEEQWKYEDAKARQANFNRHTLFFVPMQYWAFLVAASAVTNIITNVIRL